MIYAFIWLWGSEASASLVLGSVCIVYLTLPSLLQKQLVSTNLHEDVHNFVEQLSLRIQTQGTRPNNLKVMTGVHPWSEHIMYVFPVSWTHRPSLCLGKKGNGLSYLEALLLFFWWSWPSPLRIVPSFLVPRRRRPTPCEGDEILARERFICHDCAFKISEILVLLWITHELVGYWLWFFYWAQFFRSHQGLMVRRSWVTFLHYYTVMPLRLP